MTPERSDRSGPCERLPAPGGAVGRCCACRRLPGASSLRRRGARIGFQPSDNPVTVDNVTKNDKLAELAKGQHPRILATYGGEYSDPKLERMVAKVVGNLTTVSGNPAQTYRITILNSPNVNAFALPGGYLYVTRGLLALANDSAELAAVIAHEMGHVTANHGLQRQQKEAEEELATKVVTDVLGEIAERQGGADPRQAAGSRSSRATRNWRPTRSASRRPAAPATIRIAAARFLQSMAAYSDLRSVSGATDASLDFLASHPNAPQRIELAQRHARQFGAPGIGTRDRDSFLAGIDGLLFGDTPEEGYVRGTTFLHPRLGVSFSVPPGFVIDNFGSRRDRDRAGRHGDPLRRRGDRQEHSRSPTM